MKNKQLHTLDLSQCRTEDPANFEFFFTKLDQFCNIRYLTLEAMQPDLSNNIESIGDALAENKRLEVLVLRDNRIKWVPYQNFWTAIMPNRSRGRHGPRRADSCCDRPRLGVSAAPARDPNISPGSPHAD